MTGGRLKRIERFVKHDDSFCFTYGDGVSDVNITQLIKFHTEHGKKATITATRPPGRYGALKFGLNNRVEQFQEKPDGDGSWINGGFFVLSPEVISLVEDDKTTWEDEPLRKLANTGDLVAYKHEGFWQPMDTLREKSMLNELWNSGNAPWAIWE